MLETIIKEMAAMGATGSGAVASFRSSLFGSSPITRTKKKKNKRLREDASNNFDPSDVISKMKAVERKIKTEDVVGFALEDEEGSLIKVYVQADQAKDFEQAIGVILGGSNDEEVDIGGNTEGGEEEDKETSSMEIAEALFKLKDRFNIVDVDWGDIAGDSEEEQEVSSEEGAVPPGQEGAAVPGAEGDVGAEEVPPEGMEPEMGAGGEDEEGAKTALQQVIDMLKSQADATKAEAEAKKAEADAKIAMYSARGSAEKVKQEEEILDMEDYYSGKDDETKEAKRLAKLARWKHDQASDAQDVMNQVETPELTDEEPPEEDMAMDDDMMGGEEEEEDMGNQDRPKKIQIRDLSKILLRHLKAN